MTNREWFGTTCGRFGMNDAEIDVLMVNQGINPDEEVDPKSAKRALCNEFATIIPMANVSEGGFSASYNLEAIKMWYKVACEELGIKNRFRPALRNRSNIW